MASFEYDSNARGSEGDLEPSLEMECIVDCASGSSDSNTAEYRTTVESRIKLDPTCDGSEQDSSDLHIDTSSGQTSSSNIEDNLSFESVETKSNSSSKRTHNTLSLETKLEIIQRLENGESAIQLAALYNLGRATVFDIKRKKGRILHFASQLRSDAALKNRKTMRGGKGVSKIPLEKAVKDFSVSRGVKEETPEINTSSTKRKHNVLSLEDKIEVIQRLENGESIGTLAMHYNIGRATVFDIKSKKDEILSFASQLQTDDGAKKRKTMRKANDEALEEAVYMWYVQRLYQGLLVTGIMLTEKALELNRLMGGPADFKASSGWLKNFKTRRGIKKFNVGNLLVTTDKPVDDYSFLEAYLNLLQQEGYNRDDIYTADKIELNLKTMPRKSFMFQHESENTRKTLEGVTIMMCVNSSWSHALPLLMIGKSKKEKCFKKISCLPVLYRTHKDGVIDNEIFLEWYANEFMPAVKKDRNNAGRCEKVLLLLHNAPYLPNIDELNVIDGNFQVMFFPPNLASFVHSMDQTVLKKLRTMFKIQVLNRLLMSAGNEENVTKLSKRLTLKDFSYMLADTWSCLAEEKMKDVWKKLWGMSEESEKNESKYNERELKEVVEMCKSIPSLSKCDIEDIRAWLSKDYSGDFEEQAEPTENEEVITPLPIGETIRQQEDDAGDIPQIIPTHHEAIKAFEIAIEWCERQKECFPEQLILLKRLKDSAAQKSLNITGHPSVS